MRFKAQRDISKWRGATTTSYVMAGARGEIDPPVSQDALVKRYVSWVYAATTINANACASVPLRLYARGGSMRRSRGRKAIEIGDDFREVTTRHEVTDLLRNTNGYASSFESTVQRFLWLQLTGNAYLHPVIGPLGRPVSLWPLPPQWVSVIPGKLQGEPFVRGYLYGADTTTETVFTPDEVIHFRRPNPGTGISSLHYGMGVVEACWSALSLHESQRKHDVAMFANSARPDYLIIAKGRHGQQEFDAYRERLTQELGGPTRRGKPLVVSGDIDIKPLTFTAEELGDHAVVIEEIAAVTGVPVSMLRANDPNLASATAGYAQWRESTIEPMLRLDEQALNAAFGRLFPGYDGNFVLAYDSAVPDDRAADVARRTALVAAGIITPNEARTEEGYAPIAGGDELRGAPVMPAAPAPSFTFAPAPVKGVKAATESEQQQDSPQTDELSETLAKILAEQMDAVLALDLGGVPQKAAKRSTVLSVLEEYEQRIADAMRPAMLRMVGEGGAEGLGKIGADAGIFSVENPEVVKFIDEYTLRLAGKVNATTADAVMGAIRTVATEGLTPDEARKLVMAAGSFDEARADMIARTETARAFVVGEQEAWKAAGVKGNKWLLAPNPCPICVAMEKRFNADPPRVGEPVLRVGDTLQLPDGKSVDIRFEDVAGPPAHPGCRCDMIPILE